MDGGRVIVLMIFTFRAFALIILSVAVQDHVQIVIALLALRLPSNHFIRHNSESHKKCVKQSTWYTIAASMAPVCLYAHAFIQ